MVIVITQKPTSQVTTSAQYRCSTYVQKIQLFSIPSKQRRLPEVAEAARARAHTHARTCAM